MLEKLEPWDHDGLYNSMVEYAAAHEMKNAKLMWPVRIATAGKAVTPGGAVEICQILGKRKRCAGFAWALKNWKTAEHALSERTISTGVCIPARTTGRLPEKHCHHFCGDCARILRTCLFLPNVRDSLLSYIQNIVDSAAIATEAGGFSALRILKTICAPPLSAYSTESFHFFLSPPFQSGLNAAVLGAMAASYQIKGLSLLLYAAALIPHGIF